jgi:hypothetical protein
MIFRYDGKKFPGPRNDYYLSRKYRGNKYRRPSQGELLPSGTDCTVGDRYIQCGNFRLGEVDSGRHFSLSNKNGKTAMIWRSDGTEHPGNGRRRDWGLFGGRNGRNPSKIPNKVSAGHNFV